MQKTPEYVADTLPSEMLEEIGKIIFLWGRLEYQLTNLIAVGFDLPKDAQRALTIGMEINVLCGILRTITTAKHWITHKDLRDRISNLAKEISEKSETRNKYAHGVFGYDLDKINEFSRYLFKKTQHRISPGSERITIQTLRADSDEARLLLGHAIDLTVMLKAWKQKSSQQPQ